MARPLRIDIPGCPQHLVQRGVDRKPCFYSDEDRRYYLATLHESAIKNSCAVHAYVLMTNHVHLLVTGNKPGSISTMMQYLGRKYVLRFNKANNRTGTLWEGRFKSCLVDSERYLLSCYRYIEHNPLRAKLVGKIEEYRWSSARANAYGHFDPIVVPHPVFLELGKDRKDRLQNYRRLLDIPISKSEISAIRTHASQGRVLGTSTFQQRIALATGRSVVTKPQGRPPKTTLI